MFYQSLLYPVALEIPQHAWIIAPLPDKVSISIEQIHELQKTLGGHFSAREMQTFVITPADALTVPAEQALLKTLEEPPENVQIILQTDFPQKLLPTILSRCSSAKFSIFNSQFSIHFDFPKTISEAIALSDKMASEKEKIVPTLQSWLSGEGMTLTQKKAILRAIALVTKNVNPKLVLDELFFINL